MAQYVDRTFSKFLPSEPLTAARQMVLHGADVKRGDSIYDKAPDLSTEVARRLWMTQYADYTKDFRPTPENVTHGTGREWMDDANGVSVVEGDNGWFTISAKWLGEDGEKVRGAEAAEARAKEVREAGDTKGVAYEKGGGGWYTVTAPWLAEGVRVKGEQAAKDKAAELRAAGDPTATKPDETKPNEGGGDEDGQLKPVDGIAAEVLVTVDDEDGSYIVTAPWLENPERFADTEAEAADARQKALREAGPPEGWEPPAE